MGDKMLEDVIDTMVYDHPFATVMLILSAGMLLLLAIGVMLDWLTERRK